MKINRIVVSRSFGQATARAEAWWSLFIGILIFLSLTIVFVGPVAAQNGTTYTGSVVMEGGYRTTKKEPVSGEVVNEYNKKRTTVMAHYEIATKNDSKTGKKVFDLEKSKVVLENEFKVDGKNFKTDPVPITKIDGDPETGKIKSIDFKGKKWDPKRPEDSDGIEGHVDFPEGKKKSKGWAISKYKFKSGTKSAYTFNTVTKPDEKKKEPAPGSGGKKPAEKLGTISSLSYDSVSQTLSIGDALMTGAFDPSDPLLGATLTFDSYEFLGFSTAGDIAVFGALNGALMDLSFGGDLLETASIPVLVYDVFEDLFYGGLFEQGFMGMDPSSPFFDASLSTGSSALFDAFAAYLDPASEFFDPALNQYLSFSGGANFADLTGMFSADGETAGAVVGQYVTTPAPVPLPALALLTGLAGFWVMRPRKI